MGWNVLGRAGASGSEEFGLHLEEKRKHGWSAGMRRAVGEEGSDHGG